MLRFFRTLTRLHEGSRRIEAKLDAIERHHHQLAASLAEQQRETRAVMASLSLPETVLWQARPVMIPGEPGANVFPQAAVCRQAAFETPWFSFWAARLDEDLRYHRKLWEFVFVAQSLWERGAVSPGARGLGFGVGQEPLSAFFASHDCRVVATDMNADAARDTGWIDTLQHAHGKEALRRPAVCPDTLFDRNVTFTECDMKAVPADLSDFDFCWSACALEHLGSIDHGLDFVVRSIDCLKPGGWAIHTTELNLSSDDETVDHMDTVLFRRRDLEGLAERLRAEGHSVAPFDFDPGADPLDAYIDLPPYRAEPHLKVALAGYSTTSVGIIVQRGR